MLDLSEYVFSFDVFFFFFKQKTAYEMRISDWSSDVCSSDLRACRQSEDARRPRRPDSGASRSRHPRRTRRPAGQPADRRQHPYPSQQFRPGDEGLKSRTPNAPTKGGIMEIRAAEISKVIKDQIANLDTDAPVSDVGKSGKAQV